MLRGMGIRCQLHGFTIHKALQRGMIPELVYLLAPSEILHSSVELEIEDGWVDLEDIVTSMRFLQKPQQEFSDTERPCGSGLENCLNAPPVAWSGNDTYIQKTGFVCDLGTFDTPDEFYSEHGQDSDFVRDFLFRHLSRHWMNARVRATRRGQVPRIPKLDRPSHPHEEMSHAA